MLWLRATLITLVLSCSGLIDKPAEAQTENNNTTVNNSAAPAASSVTTGGTNINYQTNTAFNNDIGFGPGIICRTPSLYMLTNLGKVKTDNFDEFTFNGARNKSVSGTIGMTVPFGSSAIEDCKTMARQLARDRVISTELSLIKTCVSLAKDGIVVDPVKFPSLEKCVIKEGDPNLTVQGLIRSHQNKIVAASQPTPNPGGTGAATSYQIPKSPRLSSN